MGRQARRDAERLEGSRPCPFCGRGAQELHVSGLDDVHVACPCGAAGPRAQARAMFFRENGRQPAPGEELSRARAEARGRAVELWNSVEGDRP